MDVSVVIPTYNRSDLLPATLRSVLAQTLRPREIIVVDDGSTDETLSVLECFAPRVRTMAIAHSGGLAARNVGLRAATSSLVAFCDSDDLWRPDFLQRMADLWRIEPRTKVAYANFQIVSQDTWTPGSKFEQAPKDFWIGVRKLARDLWVFDQPIVERLVIFQPFFPSALVASRQSFLDLGGWDEGVERIVGDDFATILRLAELEPFGVVTETLVGVRKHAGNLSANVGRMNLGDADILEYVLSSRASLRGHTALIRDSVARRRRDALQSAFAEHDFRAVRSIYALLPNGFRSPRVRLKRLIAALPPDVAGGVGTLLAGIRSLPRRIVGP